MSDTNPYDQNKMQLEIDKRESEATQQFMDELSRIFRKAPSSLTKTDKQFLQARRAYLTKAQKEEWADVLAEDVRDAVEGNANQVVDPTDVHVDVPRGKPKTLEQMNRGELEILADQLGIPDAETMKNRQAVYDAVKALSVKKE